MGDIADWHVEQMLDRHFGDVPNFSRKSRKGANVAKMDLEKKKCMTPKFRVSFPNVFQAKAFDDKQEAKFSIVMLFPKSTDLKELKRAAHNAATEKFGPQDKWPKSLKMPFKNGDEKSDLEGYAGTVVVSASSKQRPGVIDQKRIPISETDHTFYAGCYARATLIAFAYDKMGNKGVSFSLQNLQKLDDGPEFSGRKKAEDEFEEVEDNADSPDSYESDDDLGF